VKVNNGAEVNVEVDAYPKRTFKGTVTNIANTANATTSADQVTNFKVKIHIEESSYTDLVKDKKEGYSPFRPGMTATVDILTQTKKDIVVVPISAIIVKKKSEIDEKTPKEEADKRQEAIFVYKDGKAELRAVTTGIQDNVNIEILSSGFERIPQVTKELTPEEQADVEKLLEKIEEDDDVQNVYHTMKEAEE